MTAKDVKRNFSDSDIKNTLWARTLNGEILRLINVGNKYISLMHGNGKIIKVETVVSVAPLASDL